MSEPAITIQAYHVSAGSNLPPSRVVIHSTSPSVWSFPATSATGTAHGTALYFATSASGGSAHYIEDVTTEEHCVLEAAIAQHAPPNTDSLGVEICASPYYTREQWLDPQVWPACVKAAQRTADLCDRYSIPKVKIGPAELVAGALGVCGHVDVSQAWAQTNHTDPGPNFPWPEFMAAVVGPTPDEDAMRLKYIQSRGKPEVYLASLTTAPRHVSRFLDAENEAGEEGHTVLVNPLIGDNKEIGDDAGTVRVVQIVDDAALFGL